MDKKKEIDSVEKKKKRQKLKKEIIEHLREDMMEAKVGISRDKDLGKSLKNLK